MKKKSIKDVFTPKIKGSKIYRYGKKSQPPKNIKTQKVLIKIIEPYSARKNNAKPILAYSTLKPDTNSDSASGKSKGARFVSAKIETKNIKKSAKKGITKKILFWNKTISTKFNEPTHNRIETRIRPIETS
jgi:hypothetical protein